MANKPSMSRVERLHREKVTRYSIRKYSFGAVSVAVAALFMFLGNGAVSVQADQIQPETAAAPSVTPTEGKDNAFRTEATDKTPLSTVARTNVDPTVEIPYSDAAKREIYVYGAEENSFDIKIKDDADKILAATVLQGGNRLFNPVAGETDKINTQYGYTANEFTTETPASEATPAVIRYSGTPAAVDDLSKDRLDAATKGESPTGMVLGWRYVRVRDTEGTDFTGSGNEVANDHAFRVMLKPQTQKYDVKDLTGSKRITVNDIDNITDDELGTIKSRLQLEYSKTNTDARLQDLAGTDVNNPSQLIKEVVVSPTDSTKLAVTYNDGSVDTIEKSKVLNVRPKGIIPFSTAKEIYVYKGEETNLEFGVTDDSGKIKDLRIVQAKGIVGNSGAAQGQVVNSYGLTMTSQTDTNGINAPADSPAITKIVGTVNVPDQPKFVGTLMTRYLVAEDLEGAVFSPPLQNTNLLQEGAFKLVVREQTQKYDIESQTNEADKIAVSDVDNLTEADFAKIKENIKIKYSTADDARLSDKNNTEVENASNYIQSVAKQSNQLVVTYKDGSTDSVLLTNVVKLDKQPAINAVEQAAAAQIEKINGNKDATQEEKQAAIEKVNNDKKTALDAINTDAVKTQDALTQAQNAGTTAIANDNPVVAVKPEAKQAIDEAVKAKEKEINKNANLSDKEKADALNKVKEEADKVKAQIDAAPTNAAVATAAGKIGDVLNKVNPVGKELAKETVTNVLAAKDKAKDLADKQLAKIDEQPNFTDTPEEATTAQTAVDDAEDKGIADVTAVNPVAKEEAKKAIADELATKNAEIDGRKDLTEEEKTKAKAEAKQLADAQLAKIDEQPDNVDDPKALPAVQTAVVDAGKKGVADVKAVNPEAVAKPAAKQAIDDKLAEQLKEIANTPDATDEEKAVVVQAAKDLAEQAKQAIDDAKTDAEVKKLQAEAKEEINKSVPVVEDKPNARKAIEAEAKAKKEAIDARTDLTPKAKENLKSEVDAIANQAKKAVDKATSATDVDKIEEADKAAIKAVDEVKEPVNKTLVQDPAKLTDEEKAKILEEVKKVNPTAKDVKYNEEGNIEVTTENGDKGIVIPTKLVKTEVDLDNGKGGNDINKPLDKVVVQDPANLTDAEKAKLVDEVKAVNPDAVVTIDDKGTVTVSAPDGETAAILAVELVRTKDDTTKPDAGNSEIVKPADKVVGEPTDPAAQTKVEEKLKELNPEAKSIKFDDKGTATVTLNDGTTATIPAKDLFKSPEDAAKPNAGNDIVKPADKTVVANPEKLTDAEKKAVEDKVKAVNPDATVVVDDKGNTTVTTPEGKTAIIPASDLTKSSEDAAKPEAGNNVNTPAAKTEVQDLANLTPEEKKMVEDKVKAVNPDATVVVDDKGNATVTTPEGKTAVIPASDLTKSSEDAAKPEAGNNVNTPATRVLVGDKAKLTADEIEKVKESIKAVNPGSTVVVDENGNATVTTPEGKTATIPAAQLVKDAKDVAAKNNGENTNVDFEKETVVDLNNLTDAEKEAAKAKIKGVNADVVEVIFDKAGDATVITKDGKVYTIVSKDIFKQRPSTDNGSSANASQTASAQANARKASKELPNTGTADSTVAMVAAAASALLGLGLAGRRKEDEEA
ncbi:DUF1542 domain-containing protein [Streptococcus sp. Marseille-Q5986]|uniref:DUF1542 domain-containing protein n=1 Tax=Streptococcus sp. Marseille-Q5986 TaxID=2972782 RepID=UPI0022648646|nr:DUF1542 domain-containing protein [Streptococcus sp. Marseille-Q5986]